MLIGQTLMNGTTAYSEWYAGLGEAATFGCQVIVAENTAKLGVTVQTKNADELDSAAVTATGGSMTELGTSGVTTTQRATGIKQLWRCKYDVTIGTTSSDETFVHFEMLQPIWEENRNREQAILPAPHAPGILGRTLVSDSDYEGFTSWAFTTAENGTFACELFDLSAGATFTVTIEHKAVEDNDSTPGSPTNSLITFNTAGAQVKSTRATGLKQMFRYRLALSDSESVSQVHYRLLSPMFEPH